MTMRKHEITADDLMSTEAYTKVRKERRADLVQRKKLRRLEIGPHCSMHFENYESMWLQVQEMLYIEKGGAEQIPGELAAYNPLVPKGAELVVTVLFEIDDPNQRKIILSRLGGVEETAFIEVDGDRVAGVAEADQDRSTAEGKASSVQFIHFPFKPKQIEAFRKPGARILVGFTHPHYGHIAVMSEPVRAALAEDFD
ncbi:DUF3501 family protein [Hypericibacter sp.]|uniref:DUF3501 family protein n=1 Tax=Hypericibacter sp. TaxID=2705401 RepID=UPI003D6D403A